MGARLCATMCKYNLVCRAGEPGLQEKGGWDALLTRYLRAEKYNVQKAEKRLRDQAVWRSAFCPKGQFSEVSYRHASASPAACAAPAHDF